MHRSADRSRLRGLVPILAWLVVTGAAAPGLAADRPQPPSRGWLDPLLYRDAVARGIADLHYIEAVEMFSAIVSGSQMGPNDGWFHPGQSRYGWKWLVERYDRNHDGTIARDEFQGPAEFFQRLDRDRDGILTAKDFDWSEQSPYLRQLDMAERWFGQIDHAGGYHITREEWQAFFDKMARGKDHITPEDLRAGLFPAMPPQKPSGPPPLIMGLLTGEIGSIFPGPSVGQEAPDFTLPREDGQGFINLAKQRGGRPAVLVFGSFT